MDADKKIDVLSPSAGQVHALIANVGKRKKLVWTAWRIVRGLGIVEQFEELGHKGRKRVLKRIERILKEMAVQGTLHRRAVLQGVGYGNEIGFDYIRPKPIGIRAKPNSSGG